MARWHSCNVLQTGPERREVWHFSAKRDTFVPDGVLRVPIGQPLPPKVIGKTLSALWQKKLNLAFLPPEQVFLRAVQLPATSRDETVAMVELQLRSSPRCRWHRLSGACTCCPVRSKVSRPSCWPSCSGTWSSSSSASSRADGFMADPLELPLIDQLAARPADKDGAWVYPSTGGVHETALVAWWFGGTLHSIGLLNAPHGAKRARAMADQFGQMGWAGELEGWLKGIPGVYLVARRKSRPSGSRSCGRPPTSGWT